ncbi:MAG: hypothetical protein HPY64_01240 [Anaerolineae bacterium]|nr:hypothetical protein [Anaerolineae bacterium]
MTTTLTRVLQLFEQHNGPLSLAEMAHALDTDPDVVAEMLTYWVQRGRLREVNDDSGQCIRCSGRPSCPFVVRLPRRYELATGPTATLEEQPPCSCCG